MAFINVSGKSDIGIKKWEYTTAAGWMLERLAGKRLASKIELNIKLVPSLYKIEKKIGDCEWKDDNIRPREFIIRIDSSRKKKIQLHTLAHELVHVKQFARGELYDYIYDHKTRWKRQKYDNPFKMSHDQYMNLPWEVEAYKLESIIYNEWINRDENK